MSLGYGFRFGVRQLYGVYRAYPARKRLGILYHALADAPGRRAGRLRAGTSDVDASNAVLQDEEEWRGAAQRVEELGLVPHYSPAKNWDFLKAFALVLREVPTDAPVLDAGSGSFSVVGEWLRSAGYRNVHACDFFIDHVERLSGVKYHEADLTRTGFPDASFRAVTCLSVLEHNVDLRRFFQEMRRLLRPRGLLVLSTDFWPQKIRTEGIQPYGPQVGDTKIFDVGELEAAVSMATEHGFAPNGPVRYAASQAPISWRLIPWPYTFAFLSLRRT